MILGESPKEMVLDRNLQRVAEKLQSGARLDIQDGIDCLTTPDLFGLGRLADAEKRKRYGRKVTYVLNRQINPSNFCVLTCSFCKFSAQPDSPKGFEMTIKEILDACREMREVHIVGGLHPTWDYEFYLEMIRKIRARFPDIQIKAWTAVEVDYFGKLAKKDVREVLADLKEAGMNAMTGGGAEVLSQRVRNILFPAKIDADRWLDIHRMAHETGIRSNATLLYGHIETPEEVALHLLRLREVQDATGGFMSFIPLALQHDGTGLADRPTAAGLDLRVIAAGRLLLDNVPHIKAYWVMLGVPTATVALSFGADDLDGTIGKETIAHMAGATSPVQLLREQLEALIRDAGMVPAERDAYHNEVEAATA
jgi:aminodeoxyfutalosine synthase